MSQQQHFESQLDQQHKQQHTLNNQQQLSYQQQHGIQKQQPKLQYQQSQHKIPPQQQNKPQHQQQHYQHETKQHIQTLTETLAQMQQRKQQQQHNNLDVELMLESLFVFSPQLADIQANETCDWLVKTGFPQYAKLYRDGNTQIDTCGVKADHPFLDDISLKSLLRRIEILNTIASLKLNNRLSALSSVPPTSLFDTPPNSSQENILDNDFSEDTCNKSSMGRCSEGMKGRESNIQQNEQKLQTFQEKQLRQSLNVIQQQHHKHQQQQQKHRTASSSSSDSSAQEDELIINNKYNDKNSIITSYNDKNSIIESHKNEIVPKNDETKKNINKSINSTTTTNNNNNNNNSDVSDTTPLTPSQRRQKQHDDVIKSIQEIDLDALLPSFKQPIKAENRPESVEAETVKSKLEENKYGDSSDDSYMENLSLIRDFYQNIPQLADEGDGDDKNNNNNNNNNEIECSGDDDEHDGYDDDDTDDPFERLMQLSQSLMSHTSTQRHNDSIFGTTKHPIKVRYSRSFTHAKRNIHAHTTQTYVSDDNIFNLRLNRHRNETLLHQRTKNQNGKCNFNETAEKSFNQLSTQVTPTSAKPPFKNLFRRASKAFNKSFKRKQSRDNKVAKNEENKSGDALGNNKKSEESSKDNNGDENQTNYTTTYNNNNNNKNNINSMHYKEPNHEEQQARFNSPTTQTPVRDVRGDFEAILNLLYVNIFKLSKDEEEEEDDDDGDSRSNSSVLTPSSTDATFNFSPKLCITPNHFVAGDEDDDEEDGLRKGYDDDVLSRMFGPCFKKMYKDDININNNNNNQKENNNNGKKNVNNKNNIKITNKLVDNDDGGRYDVMSTNNRTLIKINGQDHSGNYDNDVFNKHNNNLNNMENNDNTLRNNRVKDDNNITTTTTTTNNNNRNNNDDEVVHVDGREMSVDSGVGWSRGGDDEDVDVTKSKMAPLARINSCEYELEERRGGGTDNDFDHKNANKNNKDEESNRSGDNDMETFRSVDDDDEEDEDNNARDDDNDDDDDEEEDDDDDGWVYPDIPLRERSDSGIGSSLSRRPSNNRTVRWKSFLNSRYNKNSNYCNTQQRNNNQTNNVNNDIEKKSLNDVTKNDVNNNSNNNNIINNNNNNKNNIISTSINNNNNNNIINTLTDLNKSIQYDTRYLTTTQTTKLKRFCTHRLIAVFEALNCSDRKLCRSLTDKKPKPLHLTPPKHHLTLRLRNGDDPLEGDLFGVPLEVVRIRTGQSVPRCVMLAMKQLKRSTGDMEGVFRKPGSKLRLQQLHRDCVLRPDKIDYDRTSAYDLAGLIRHFLRSIPGKLFDSVTTKLLVHIFKNVKSEHHQREMVQCCMVLMSEDHRDVAHVFTLFLHHLALKCASTKMTASNLSLCLTPSLFHVKMPSLSSPSSSLSSSSSKRQTSQYNKCLSIQKHLHTALTFLINHAPSIFTDLKGLMVQCQLRASGYTHTNTDIRTDNHHYLYIHPSIHHSLLTTLCNNIVTPLFLKLQESTTSSKGWSNVITIDPRSLSCSSSSSSSSSSLSYGPIEVSHKRASSKDSLHTHKTSIIIKAPPIEILIAVLRYRGSWNDDVLKWRQLQTMGDNMEVYEFVLNCMAPQQPRIFTLLRAWRTDLPKGGCMLVSQSVEHHATLPTIKSPRHKPVSERASSTAHQSLDSPNPHPFQSTCVQPSFSPLLLSPKQRSILRLVKGEMVAEHWVIVPSSSSSTRVTMISSVDFKGYSPEWYERVYTYVNAHHMHKLACFFHERLHRHMNLMGPETCV